jgi:hypothetical protein
MKLTCWTVVLPLLLISILTAQTRTPAPTAGLQIAPDLDQRLAKFREVRMPFHSQGLSAREQKMVEKLVDASRYLEEIFWQQSDPEALALYQSLRNSSDPQAEALRRCLWINACILYTSYAADEEESVDLGGLRIII